MYRVILLTAMRKEVECLYEDRNLEACKLVADAHAHRTYKVRVVDSVGNAQYDAN